MVSQKRVLLLGGLRYLKPVIEIAHEYGMYVITCDNVPGNIAHSWSDEYHNVSILDREAVLELARRLQIDGIMSFAVDPGVLTAAYVADRLGLPTPPYESVRILQNKILFRNFMQENRFTTPLSKGYTDIDTAIEELCSFTLPVIVKPSDSAGSKGVTRVDHPEDLRKSAETALAASFGKEFIVEEFIEQDGFTSGSDCFSVDNELKYISFSSQRFDSHAANPYTPSALSWPTATISEKHQEELKKELQRMVSLLNLGTTIYNIEVRIGKNGKAYIMEVSPRGGGNRNAEIQRYATGVDMIKAAVLAAVGEKVDVGPAVFKENWGEILLHSDQDGIFDRLHIDESRSRNVVEIDLWVNPGERINAFRGANDTIGTLVLKFDSQEELSEAMLTQRDWLKVLVTRRD